MAAAESAFADDVPPDVVTADLEKQAAARLKAKEAKTAWKRKLALGATGSSTSSSNVVGAVDGTTIQVGVLLDGEAVLTSGAHEWQNTLKVQHARSKTPVMESWVKSADNLELQSTWLFRLASLPWIGPFARARMQTQVVSGYDVRPGDVTIERTAVDGTVTTLTGPAETKTELTGAFEPIIVAETLGFFANPLDGKKIALAAKLGAGGQHIFTRGGFALSGFDADTQTVKLKEVETTHQAGGELELEAKGELTEILKWNARSRFFMPLVTQSEQTLSGADAMTTELGAGLSVKLAKWASLDYVLTMRRIPLVLDAWQVQHGLLLTTGFNLL